jgi:hypothetical protein
MELVDSALPVNPTVDEVKEMVREPRESKSITDVNLENIRERATAARLDIARTIAELEEWREEIDVTIAFLRAQRR